MLHSELLETVHDWAKADDISSPVDVIYLDYRKAFDSVPHGRLLEKLKLFGINSSIRKWISSFLTNRWQKVSVNGSYSDAIQVTSGVPQGSVLGPVLFLLYINDMAAEVGNKLKLFADDSKLYAEVQSEGDAQTLLADLNAITDWEDKWQLSFIINVDKCKVLHIGKKNTNYVYSMRSGDYVSEIESVQTEKDLGVRFDNELRFSDHIKEICQKGFQRIIRRTFTYMDENTFLTLYKSLVCPVLEYCSTVWSTYYKKDSERIEKVQRKATKLVCTIKDWDYPERLKHLKLPSLVYRRRRADLLQEFRYFKGLDLLKGDELFTVDKSAKTRGHSLKLVKARVNKKIMQKTLAYRVITDWNSLPENVIEAESINSFKHRLEEFWRNVSFKYKPSESY